MPSAVFEPAVTEIKRLQTYALSRTAPGMGSPILLWHSSHISLIGIVVINSAINGTKPISAPVNLSKGQSFIPLNSSTHRWQLSRQQQQLNLLTHPVDHKSIKEE
jgi:hypothetical protein